MPDIYRTDNLDEAIDIVQDPTKVIERKENKRAKQSILVISLFSDIRSFCRRSTLVHVERNGRVTISRKRSVQNQYAFMSPKIQ